MRNGGQGSIVLIPDQVFHLLYFIGKELIGPVEGRFIRAPRERAQTSIGRRLLS